MQLLVWGTLHTLKNIVLLKIWFQTITAADLKKKKKKISSPVGHSERWHFFEKVPLKPRAKDVALAGWRVPRGTFQVRVVGPEEAGRRLRSGEKEAGLG